MQLEWARIIYEKTGRNILIVAPLCVSKQTAEEEAPKLGLQVNICKNMQDVKKGINITNYEIIDKFDPSEFVAVVLDESSILKAQTGKTKTQLTDLFSKTPYKLCCSATPAPNEFMELLNQAEFLGIKKTTKSQSEYFIHDFSTNKWRLKGHATDAFWQWVCTWCMMVDKPSDIGFDDVEYQLPKLNVNTIELKINVLSDDLSNGLFRDIETSATGFNREKRLTMEQRCERSAEIVMSNDEQFIIWCYLNDESRMLKKLIPEAVEVRGDTSDKDKEKATEDFKNGTIRVLISKPSIFGYGMNFQKCHNVIFCGLDYSYESYYQALKRTHRFGQEHDVNCYIVIGDTEMGIVSTVKEKEERQREIKNQMRNSVKTIQMLEIKGKETVQITNTVDGMVVPQWI